MCDDFDDGMDFAETVSLWVGLMDDPATEREPAPAESARGPERLRAGFLAWMILGLVFGPPIIASLLF